MPSGVIGGGGGLAPFDKHPADPGALNGCATNLASQATYTLDVADQTLGAYEPATQNWNGLCAPELNNAPRPLVADAADMNLSLTWGSVAVRYWATQVEAFNKKVDEIVATLNSLGGTYGATGLNGNPPTTTQIAAAKAVAIAAAERQWQEAYQTHIVAGGATTAAMFREGPTEQHLAVARQVGLIPPGQGPIPWKAVGNAALGNVWPNLATPLGPAAGLGLWLVGRGFAVADINEGILRLQAKQYVHGYWRTVNGQRQYIKPYWRFRPSANAALRAEWDRWSTIGKWGARVGRPLTLVTAGADQWVRDSGRTDLNTGERFGRAAGKSLAVGGGAVAGGLAGAKGGAIVGALIGGPVGAVVGAVAGGIVGGIIGSGVGDKVAPYAVDAGERVGDVVHNHFESAASRVNRAPHNDPWPNMY